MGIIASKGFFVNKNTNKLGFNGEGYGDAWGCVPSASRFLEKSSAKTFNILGPFRVA